MKNILTIDVEDWYQGLDLPAVRWTQYEKRLSVGLEFVLGELALSGVNATFFVLGVAAADHPDLVRQIAGAGHEIGTHGWSHTPVYRQSRGEFRDELDRAMDVLQSLTGRKVCGHRAAMFSLTAHTLWALDEAAHAGLVYDSSIFPVHNYRYGIPGARRLPHKIMIDAEPPRNIWEIPITTLRQAGLNWPVGGGFYARFWPYSVLACAVRRLNARGQPAVFYFHPWEFDPAQPCVGADTHWLAQATHYYRLSSTRQTLRRLLADFEWTSAIQFLREAEENS
jgi:polysaccharide deacetylase family protein (PEP-CTERM system associated)